MHLTPEEVSRSPLSTISHLELLALGTSECFLKTSDFRVRFSEFMEIAFLKLSNRHNRRSARRAILPTWFPDLKTLSWFLWAEKTKTLGGVGVCFHKIVIITSLNNPPSCTNMALQTSGEKRGHCVRQWIPSPWTRRPQSDQSGLSAPADTYPGDHCLCCALALLV